MLECSSCRKPKAPFECQLCEAALCKNCVQQVSSETFQFLAEIPEALSHSSYCGPCYDETVAPKLEEYQEVLERAKEVFIFFKTQRKEIPLIKRSKEIKRVLSCTDRDETILRLAFFSAEAGYNALVECEVNAEKVRNGAYQKSNWSGSGVPAMVDAEKIERQDMQNQIYR